MRSLSRPPRSSARPSTSSILLALLAALALVCGPLAFTPAQAADVALSGKVTGPDGKPLRYVDVSVWMRDEDDSTYYYAEELETYTDRFGRYQLSVEPGTYKLAFDDYGTHRPEFYNDKPTLRAATPVVVGEAGIVLEDVVLAAYPTITGTVTDLKGVALPSAYAVALSYDDEYGDWEDVAWSETDGAGAFELPVEPGTYRVGFFDEDGDYLAEFWDDQPTVETASDVVVDEAGVTGINARLAVAPLPSIGRAQNLARPSTDGYTAVGRVIRSNDGVWAPNGVVLTRQWLRNGAPIPGATSSTYKMTPADVGSRLSIRVTGNGYRLDPVTVTSDPTPYPVRWTSKVAVTKKAGKKKSRLSITVTSPGGTPTGTVQITLRNKKVKTVRLKNGKARVSVKNLPKSRLKYTVAYQGNATTWTDRRQIRVR